MMLPDKDELISKIGDLLAKSGMAVGELTRENASAVDAALTFVIGKIPVLRMVPGGRERVRGLLLVAIDRLPKKPEQQPTALSETDVAARLASVLSRANAINGDSAATARSLRGYDAATDLESARLIAELETLESCSAATVPQRIEVAVLKASIYGCWEKPHGAKANQQKAIDCYESAITLSSDFAGTKAEVLFRYAMFALKAPREIGGGKERALEKLTLAMQGAPVGSDLHEKCSQELTRQTKKRWSLFG
jgi:hypothetical protein